MIILLVSAISVFSLVFVFSEKENDFSGPRIVHNSTEVIPPGEYVPPEQERLPELMSHEEAVALANEFLTETLGSEFFNTHFEFAEVRTETVEVNGTSHTLSTWVVVYQFTSNGYTVDMSVAVNAKSIPKGTSRIDVDFSAVILQSQEILISEEEAKRIAQENGLEPPYKLIIRCNRKFHRICWEIVKENTEDLHFGDLAGFLIDAENGEILERWEKIF